MARKEAVFKMKLDSDDAVKNVKKLDKDFTSLRDTIDVDVSGSISAMEDRLYELSIAGKTNTKEFKQLQKQTADYKKVVIETDRSIDALAEQGRGLSTALSLAEGTVAGFQAFTGISAVLGDENEELLATITKLQAAQGVLNSIEIIKQQIQEKSIAITQFQTRVQKALNVAVGSGSKAMKLFRGALLATGVGALIVGIGALIANFDKLKKMVMGNTDAQDAYNDTLEDFNKGTQSAIKQTNKVETAFNLAKKGVISNEEALKTYNDTLGDAFGEAENLNEANALFVEKTGDYIQSAGLRAQANALFAKAAEESANVFTAGMESQVGFFDAAVAKLKGDVFGVEAQNESLRKSQKEGVKEAQKNSKQRADAFTKMAEQMLAKAIEIDEANNIINNAPEEEEKQKDPVVESAEDRNERLKQLRNENLESISMLNQTELTFETEKEEEKKNIAARGIAIIAKMRAEQRAKELKAEEEAAKKQKELEEKLAVAKTDVREKSFNLALTLTELFTSKSEKSQKRAFKITKGINIAQTIQSGLQGVINALSAKSVLPEPIASIQKGVTAASIGATTALNVKKIKATTFNGGGGGSVGGGSSGGGLSGASAGSFSIGDDTSTDTTDLNPDGSQTGQGGFGTMSKVYVTEQDITNTQNKVKAVESISTF